MRILVFHQFYTRLQEPGIARFNLFAREWAKHDIETYVVASNIIYATGEKRSYEKDEVDECGVHIIRARASSFGLNYWSFLGRLLSYISFTVSAFFKGLRAPKPDVVISSAPPFFLGVVGFMVARLRDVPFVYEIRDIWPDEAIELGYVRSRILIRLSYWLEKFLYKRATKIVVNSPGVKTFLVEEKNIDPDRVGVVENPIHPDLKSIETREDIRKAHEWEDKTIVMYNGSHAFVYNFDLFLDAAKALEDHKDLLFVIIGKGRQKKYVEDRVRDEGISNVELLLTVGGSSFTDMLAAADICMLSLKDMRLLRYIYASKFFQYMHMKRPIVAAVEGVNEDLLKNAKSGIVVAPGDSEGFQGAIVALANDGALRNSYGENGHTFVTEFHAPSYLGERYRKIIDSCLSS